MASKYRAMYGLRHGQLHTATGTTTKKIPKEVIEDALNSHNEHVAAMAKLAKAYKKSDENQKYAQQVEDRPGKIAPTPVPKNMVEDKFWETQPSAPADPLSNAAAGAAALGK